MVVGHREFNEIVVADFEFLQPPGCRPRPKYLVARELGSGRLHHLYGDDLLSRRNAPYPTGPDALFIAYYAPAEINCHLALGWPLPTNVLDLFVEFRNLTNGRPLRHGSSLLGALEYFGLPAIDAAAKDAMRDLIMTDRIHTAEEWRNIGAYCQSDVDGACKLFAVMPQLHIEHALLRGQYQVAVARMEHAGIPLDNDYLVKLDSHLESVKHLLIKDIDPQFGVFEGRTFKADRWARWLAVNGIPWPRLVSGRLALDDDTFRERARVYPSVALMRDLRNMLGKMHPSALAVGSDGRNRTGFWPFRARTSRNQPRASEHIMLKPKWLRGLIQAQPGHAVAYIDWCQQEFGVAAALSGDEAMLAAYEAGGDPYLNFAIQAGAAPQGATKKTHKTIRNQFKECAIGTLYGMGTGVLAERTGLPIPYADELLRLHRKIYPDFWRWSDRVVDYALLYNHLYTCFGWNLFVEGEPKPNSLRNFPVQGNAAEMLRVACCLATERGVNVVAPVHDALLIEARAGDLVGAVITARRAMAEASQIVLQNLTLRTDFEVYRHPLRYMDDDGRVMWRKVRSIIGDLEAGR